LQAFLSQAVGIRLHRFSGLSTIPKAFVSLPKRPLSHLPIFLLHKLKNRGAIPKHAIHLPLPLTGLLYPGEALERSSSFHFLSSQRSSSRICPCVCLLSFPTMLCRLVPVLCEPFSARHSPLLWCGRDHLSYSFDSKTPLCSSFVSMYFPSLPPFCKGQQPPLNPHLHLVLTGHETMHPPEASHGRSRFAQPVRARGGLAPPQRF